MPHLHARRAAVAPIPVSLLRLSAGTRLIGAGVVIAAIWLAVFWAWS